MDTPPLVLNLWSRVISPALLLWLLAAGATFARAQVQAVESALPWPDRTYAAVTETFEKAGRKSVLTYRVSYERRGLHGALRFEGVDSLSVDGKNVPKEDLPSGPLFQADIQLDANGWVVGLLEPELFEASLRQLSVTMERSAKDPKQREVARALGSEAGLNLVRVRMADRYEHWMLGYLYRPEAGAPAAEFEGDAPLFGISLPLHVETSVEESASADEVTLRYESELEATGRGDEVIAAMDVFARESGLKNGGSKDPASSLDLRITTEIHGLYAKRTMLPKHVTVVRDAAANADAVQRSRTEYRFEWSERPKLAEPDSPVIIYPRAPSLAASSRRPADPADESQSRIGISTREASFARRSTPRYPPRAVREMRKGQVLVQIRIAADGRGREVSIFRSSGHADLDDAALDSIKKSTFRPELVDGNPIESVIIVPVDFSLKES